MRPSFYSIPCSCCSGFVGSGAGSDLVHAYNCHSYQQQPTGYFLIVTLLHEDSKANYFRVHVSTFVFVCVSSAVLHMSAFPSKCQIVSRR